MCISHCTLVTARFYYIWSIQIPAGKYFHSSSTKNNFLKLPRLCSFSLQPTPHSPTRALETRDIAHGGWALLFSVLPIQYAMLKYHIRSHLYNTERKLEQDFNISDKTSSPIARLNFDRHAVLRGPNTWSQDELEWRARKPESWDLAYWIQSPLFSKRLHGRSFRGNLSNTLCTIFPHNLGITPLPSGVSSVISPAATRWTMFVLLDSVHESFDNITQLHLGYQRIRSLWIACDVRRLCKYGRNNLKNNCKHNIVTVIILRISASYL